MVGKSSSVYLLIGQESAAKDIKLKALRQELLCTETAQFNYDTLYAKELNLKSLQEYLLYLPLKANKRFIVVKAAQDLKKEIKDFLSSYIKNPKPNVILALDIDKYDPKDFFLMGLLKYAHAFRFEEPKQIDTFTLSRQIDTKSQAYALGILNKLLENGEKPERILGGLRYSWEKNFRLRPAEMKRRLKYLLNCDIDIKTGRLKPAFALERLVVNLCLS